LFHGRGFYTPERDNRERECCSRTCNLNPLTKIFTLVNVARCKGEPRFFAEAKRR
jgi:hypothetical protein